MSSDHGPTSGENQNALEPAPLPEPDGELATSWTESNRAIGAAIGIAMTRYGMTYPDASVFLEELAGSHQRGLLDLARAITTSHWPVAGSFDRTRDGSPVGRLEQTVAESTAGRLLDLLVETTDLNDLLKAVADLAVESVPGCDFASITLIHDGLPTTVASSDVRALRVDMLQYSGDQGPCLQAARTDEVVEVHDLVSDPTPGSISISGSAAGSTLQTGGWRREAVAVGAYAILAMPIASNAKVAAALNLYTTRADGWPSNAQAIGEDLAIYTGDAITLAYRHGDPSDPTNRV